MDSLQEPVPGFGLRFHWQAGEWEAIFDKQIALIRMDIKRARLDGKFIVYLSCPLSGRGGGHPRTNVDVAKHTERRILSEWGDRFWVLNPAQYQMESHEGAGLLAHHASKATANLADIGLPSGGDYMRMWTKVLVEDDFVDEEAGNEGSQGAVSALKNKGRHIDAFYFLGPSDVRSFFDAEGKRNLSVGIEEYFARKHATDREFSESFGAALPSLDAPHASDTTQLRANWERKRREFLRYYALRASSAYSFGSHDEWAIYVRLNELRRRVPDSDGGGIANQIAGFFDGRALAFAGAEGPAALGYGQAT